jgi:hypothetical protein
MSVLLNGVSTGVSPKIAATYDCWHSLTKNAHNELKGRAAIHYTVKKTEETAEEVDNLGKDGLKATEATVTHIDRGAKTMAVKTADGPRRLIGAATDAGKDVTVGTAYMRSSTCTLSYSFNTQRMVKDYTVVSTRKRMNEAGDCSTAAPSAHAAWRFRTEYISSRPETWHASLSGRNGYTIRIRPSHSEEARSFLPGLIRWADERMVQASVNDIRAATAE